MPDAPIAGRVFTVANQKGGVGKSTIAEHLAAYQKAAIVDLDLNGDSARFGDQYKLEVHRAHDITTEGLYDLMLKLRNEGKSVVIDCPPGVNPLTRLAVLCADVVVCPTRPGPHDIYALGRIISVVREAAESRGPVPLLFLCNFYRRTQVADIFCGVLQAMPDGEFVGKVWERKEYAEAIDLGKPVWESHPKSTGATEMLNLVDFLTRATAVVRLKVARGA